MRRVRLATVASVLAFTLVPAFAFATPLTLNSLGVVGTLNGGGTGSDPDTELVWAQHLLDMAAASEDWDFTPETGYATSDTEYAGVLSPGVKTDGGSYVVPVGYEWVFAKYDGQNAGYILFHLPTWGSTTIPQYPFSIWAEKDEKFAISHFTVYNAVPDGGSMAILLGMALIGLAGVRRMMR